MILAIDIGNTNINFALMKKIHKPDCKYVMATDGGSLIKILKGIKRKFTIDKIIVVSVAPVALKRVKNALKIVFKNKHILIVGKNIKVPIKCEYNMRQIGQDRLVTAHAAKVLYGLPILVVDFGTAVTFDAVSGKGVYLGGLIVPGIKMSLLSLHDRTSMLPRAHLMKIHSFIGKDTKSSIRNGMIYGYSAICDGMISRFRKKIDKKIKVIATGGDARLVASYTSSIKKIDSNLSIKGLYLLAQREL